jgi:hypothetical protein
MIDFFIGFIIFGLMIAAFFYTVKKLKSKTGICGGSCSGCQSSSNSEKTNNTFDNSNY